MRAIGAPSYGPLDRLAEIDMPVRTPHAGQVRVRTVASALNPADYKVVLGTLKFVHGRKRPLVVGYDFSGTVDAVGPSVEGVSVGDDVFGFLPYGPGNDQGAFAESVIARVDEIAHKPPGVSHEVAAACATTGVTALQCLRNLGRLPAEGGRVLITGASGGVGSMAISVAKRLGAEVTAVGSGQGLELARRLGAAQVIDRTEVPLPGGIRERFDVILDAAAVNRWRDWRGTLKPGGAFVTTLPSLAFVADKLRSMLSSTRLHFVNVKSRPADLQLLASWLERGMEVPLASTIPVRDVAKGLADLQRKGGRVSVRVAGGF